jgi:4-hydroxybenzoate polyprenyltransferase
MVLITLILVKYTLLAPTRFSWIELKVFVSVTTIILLTIAATYRLNDIFDNAVNKLYKPEKIDLSNTISVKKEWFLYWFFSISAGMLSFFLSTKPIHYFILFGTPAILYIHFKFLKKIVFIGNIVISILVCIPIYIILIFDFTPIKSDVLIFDNSSYYQVCFYMIFTFLVTLIRGIIKDIECINSHLKIKAKTLPILLGRKRAAKVAFFFGAVLLVFVMMLLKFLKNNFLFLSYGIIFILLPLSFFMYKLWISKSKKDITKLSGFINIITLFGILSMLLLKSE